MGSDEGKEAATVRGRGLVSSASGSADASDPARSGGTLATTGASGDETVASADTAMAPAAPPGLTSGTKVGRFLVIARVGAGGMGEVYSAYDPELDRRVAIKLLRADVAGSGEVAEARLRREARTMARIVDRNLVTVHDVGVHDRRVFVAMEFVDGSTLRTWCEGKPWRAILAAYLEAGRGLAAAHAAGIVHRDFKPDNVLVARDGRVAVTDFGIARTPGSTDPDEPAVIEDIRLTTTGAIIGTPRYMAPEQLDGAVADVRSDQFSFCVSLWEALFGEHPLAPPGAGFPALREAVLGGELRPAPSSKVPPRVKQALARGLAREPAKRWPTFGELLGALDVLAPSRRWMWGVLAGAGVIAAGSIAYGAWQASHRVVDAGETCAGSEALLVGVWDDRREAEVARTFAAAHVPYADGALKLVRAGLDDWARRWVDTRTHACRTTRVYREQSEATLEAEMRCFDGQRRSARAMVDVFADASSDEIENAAWALGKLPRPERCTDLGAIAGVQPLPSDPARARLVEDLEEKVTTAQALLDAGDSASALLVLGPASVTARLVGYAPLEARIELDMGGIQMDLGTLDVARAHLDRAVSLADQSHDDVIRGEAALAEANVEYFGEHYDQADRWLATADGILKRYNADEVERASLMHLHALIDLERGHAVEAADELNQVVAIYQRHGHRDVLAIESLGALAQADDAAKRPNLAIIDHKKAIATAIESLGDHHPVVAKLLVNFGAYLLLHDRDDEALPLFQQALAIKQAVLGPDDPSLGFAVQNIASVYRRKGKWAEADAHFTRALALFEKSERTAYAVPASLYGLAAVRIKLGRPAEAVPLIERSIALATKGRSERNVSDGEKEFMLARAMWDSGQDKGIARQHALDARTIFRDADDLAKMRLAEVERWLRDPDRYVPDPKGPF